MKEWSTLIICFTLWLFLSSTVTLTVYHVWRFFPSYYEKYKLSETKGDILDKVNTKMQMEIMKCIAFQNTTNSVQTYKHKTAICCTCLMNKGQINPSASSVCEIGRKYFFPLQILLLLIMRVLSISAVLHYPFSLIFLNFT